MLPVSLPSPASFEDIIPGSSDGSRLRGSSFPSITHLDSSSSSGVGSAESVNDDDDDDDDREASSSSSAMYDTDDI